MSEPTLDQAAEMDDQRAPTITLKNSQFRRLMRLRDRLIDLHDRLNDPTNTQGPPSQQAAELRPMLADLERGIGLQSSLPDEPIGPRHGVLPAAALPPDQEGQ